MSLRREKVPLFKSQTPSWILKFSTCRQCYKAHGAVPWLKAILQQTGELTGLAKTMVSIWSIFNCMDELAMLFLEGRKRYGRQAVTPCSGAGLWSHGHTKFIIPSTDTGGVTAFVWIKWCQDTKQQGCNFTRWLQESCSDSGQCCPHTNSPGRAQGLPRSVTLSTSTLVQLWVSLRAVTPRPSEQSSARQRQLLRALLLSLHGDFCVTDAKS